MTVDLQLGTASRFQCKHAHAQLGTASSYSGAMTITVQCGRTANHASSTVCFLDVLFERSVLRPHSLAHSHTCSLTYRGLFWWKFNVPLAPILMHSLKSLTLQFCLTPPLSLSLSLSLALSIFHSPTLTLSCSLTLSLPCSLSLPLSHPLTPLLSHSLTFALAHSRAHSPARRNRVQWACRCACNRLIGEVVNSVRRSHFVLFRRMSE